MKCTYCGTDNNENAAFCGHCGQPLKSASLSSEQSAQKETAAAAANKGELTINADVFANFWSYVKGALKTPNAFDDHLKNGIFSLALLCIFLPISIVNAMNQLYRTVGGWVGSEVFGSTLSVHAQLLGFDAMFKGMLTLALCIAFYALLIFICLKVARREVSYSSIIERFGSLSVPLMVLSLALFFISYLNLQIYLFLLILATIGIQVMFFLTMFSFSKKAHFDTFYLTLICHAVYTIVLYFALKSYFINLIMNLPGLLNN
ncbi:zinc ribbon domain-containing protein [Sporolactobacillus inulinus]|uniref:zinc ribbon domain-containing protein n=1 Tax=Sporolactobacillus inulinus TaxID=2078 RepID=UPI0011664946|nr:zinc ribbon domain-containing protein [Sporolactobacillus inulinus]GEB76317.1 hypothetical protein SIN01_06620 [Sporolactobacillus inulinus]